MKKFFRLLGVQLNLRFGLSAFRELWRQKRAKALGTLAVLLLVVVGLGTLLFFYGWGIKALFELIRPMGMGLMDMLVTLLLLITPLLTLLGGMMAVLSVLYFGKDSDFLAMLPLRQHTVFAVKFMQVMLTEYAICAAMLVPPMIFYPVAFELGYLLRCLLVLLCTPMIPLVVAALLSMLLMRFNAIWRHRDAIAVVGGLVLTLGAVVGQQLLIARMPQGLNASFVLNYMLGRKSLVDAFTTYYPPAKWAAEALGPQGWGSLGLLVISSLGGLALVLAISSRIYYRGVLAMQETLGHKKRNTAKLREQRSHGPAMAMFIKEWRLILRTPVYALNALAGVIVLPIFVLLPTLYGASSPEMAELMQMVTNTVDKTLQVGALAGIVAFCAGLNTGAGTVLSREGKSAWLAQIFPMPARTQVAGKLLFGLSISWGIVGIAVLSIAVALPLPGDVVALGCLLGGLLATWSTILSVLVDVQRPWLTWTNPTQAIKQNMNVILSMLIQVLVIGALALGGWALKSAGLGFWSLAGAMLGLLALLIALSAALLLGTAQRAYDRIA